MHPQLISNERGEARVTPSLAQTGRRLRIAFVITRSDSVGGASIHVRDFSRTLLAAGHDVKVFIGGEGPVTEALAAAGVPYVSLSHFVREVSLSHDCRALIELRKALQAFNPDLVSTHTSKAGFIGRVVSRSLRIPVFYTPHCWSFANGFRGASLYLWAERLARFFGVRIIAVSEAERKEGLSLRAGGKDQLVTVHNGMPDISVDLRSNPKISPPRIVMIGRCEQQKDHYTLFHALAHLSDLPWTLDCIGDGPLRAQLEVAAQTLGIANRIRFLGYCPNVARQLADAQIFALVTNWESFPRSILEAMRAGLPVIATDVGGTSESVSHGETGYVVSRKDVPTLATYLRALVSRPELRKKLGDAGRARYESYFTFAHMVENTLKVWEDVLGFHVARPDSSTGEPRQKTALEQRPAIFRPAQTLSAPAIEDMKLPRVAGLQGPRLQPTYGRKS